MVKIKEKKPNQFCVFFNSDKFNLDDICLALNQKRFCFIKQLKCGFDNYPSLSDCFVLHNILFIFSNNYLQIEINDAYVLCVMCFSFAKFQCVWFRRKTTTGSRKIIQFDRSSWPAKFMKKKRKIKLVISPFFWLVGS